MVRDLDRRAAAIWDWSHGPNPVSLPGRGVRGGRGEGWGRGGVREGCGRGSGAEGGGARVDLAERSVDRAGMESGRRWAVKGSTVGEEQPGRGGPRGGVDPGEGWTQGKGRPRGGVDQGRGRGGPRGGGTQGRGHRRGKERGRPRGNNQIQENIRSMEGPPSALKNPPHFNGHNPFPRGLYPLRGFAEEQRLSR